MQIPCAVIYHNNKILLLKKAYGTYEGLYEFPGGKRNIEDPNLKYTLKRELKEEINCKGKVLNLIHFMKISKQDCNTKEDLFLYFYHVTLEENFIITLSKEHTDYKWISFDEAKTIKMIKWDYSLLDYFKHYFRNLIV